MYNTYKRAIGLFRSLRSRWARRASRTWYDHAVLDVLPEGAVAFYGPFRQQGNEPLYLLLALEYWGQDSNRHGVVVVTGPDVLRVRDYRLVPEPFGSGQAVFEGPLSRARARAVEEATWGLEPHVAAGLREVAGPFTELEDVLQLDWY